MVGRAEGTVCSNCGSGLEREARKVSSCRKPAEGFLVLFREPGGGADLMEVGGWGWSADSVGGVKEPKSEKEAEAEDETISLDK